MQREIRFLRDVSQSVAVKATFANRSDTGIPPLVQTGTITFKKGEVRRARVDGATVSIPGFVPMTLTEGVDYEFADDVADPQ